MNEGLVVFEYIKQMPEVITSEVWYELACRGYNLGLTAVWLIILMWLFDLVFTCFNKNYKKGSD